MLKLEQKKYKLKIKIIIISGGEKKNEKKERDKMRNTELLIPASSLEVLKTAVLYGADAVYSVI